MDFSILEMKNWIQSDPRLSSIHRTIEKGDSADAAHDLSHLYRVAHWALILNEKNEAADKVVAAALLHDLINLPKNHPDRSNASTLSAEAAGQILKSSGFSDSEIAEIQSAIRDHSYSRGKVPETFLGKILQDADRLEAIGAIGLMRVFSTGARIGATYFHAQDPWAKTRVLDDRAFSIDHFFTKLLLLENSFHSPKAKVEAKKRTDFMRNFLQQLGHEIGEPSP